MTGHRRKGTKCVLQRCNIVCARRVITRVWGTGVPADGWFAAVLGPSKSVVAGGGSNWLAHCAVMLRGLVFAAAQACDERGPAT